MKKFFSLFALMLIAVTCFVGCGGGATPVSGKTFTVENVRVGTQDVTASFTEEVSYKFYDNTFIFEMNVGEDDYTYFLGDYTYKDGTITPEIKRTVGSLENASDPILQAFKGTNVTYAQEKLTIKASINGVEYTIIMAE